MSRTLWAAPAAAALPVLLVLACGGYGRPAEQPPAAAPEAATAEMTASAGDCDNQPKNHTIDVGEDRVSCKEPHLSKKNDNKITWRSTTGGNLEIRFPPGQDPFPELKCPGDTPTCKSGKIATGAGGRYEYEIWLYTAAGKKLIDPGVIIDP